MTDNVFDHPKRNHAKRNVPIGDQIEVKEYHLAKVVDIALNAMNEKLILEKENTFLLEIIERISGENTYLRLAISKMVQCGEMTKEQKQKIDVGLKSVASHYRK